MTKHKWCRNPSCPAEWCWHKNHSPGGVVKGTMPFRIGKTDHDRAHGHARQKKVVR